MSDTDQHKQACEEIKQEINNLSVEEKSKFEETITAINAMIVKHGSIAILAIAFVGVTLAMEDDINEGQ